MELKLKMLKANGSIINQMVIWNKHSFDDCLLLGHVVNIRKDMSKAFILKRDKDYFVLAGNWNKGELSIYRRVGSGSITSKFKDKNSLNMFWDGYKKIMSESTQIYI